MSRQVFCPRSGSFHHNVSLLLTTQCTTQPTPIRIQLSYVVATVVFRIDDMYTYIRVYASIQILYLSRYLEVLVPRAATSATALITEGMANSNDDDDDDNNSNSNINNNDNSSNNNNSNNNNSNNSNNAIISLNMPPLRPPLESQSIMQTFIIIIIAP